MRIWNMKMQELCGYLDLLCNSSSFIEHFACKFLARRVKAINLFLRGSAPIIDRQRFCYRDDYHFRAPRTIAVLSSNLLAPRCDGHFALDLAWLCFVSWVRRPVEGALDALLLQAAASRSSVTSRRML